MQRKSARKYMWSSYWRSLMPPDCRLRELLCRGLRLPSLRNICRRSCVPCLQAFLNAYLNTRGEELADPVPRQYSWVELPPTCNLMTAQHALFPAWFEAHLPTTLLLHYAGENNFMKSNVQFDGDTIVSTTTPKREVRTSLKDEVGALRGTYAAVPQPLLRPLLVASGTRRNNHCNYGLPLSRFNRPVLT